MITLHNASCVDWLAAYDGPLFDSCVTDPPYELGFMGKAWDSSGVAFSVDTWRAVYNALKPGAHLVAFSGTRTYHRMVCAIEDAGFEIRDQLAWLYGSGFPKSLDVSKALDKAAGAERDIIGPSRYAGRRVEGSGPENGDACYGQFGVGGIETAPATDAARQWQGYGTALKPAQEPVVLARKPLIGTVAANVMAHGTGALNVDGCRVGAAGGTTRSEQAPYGDNGWRTGHKIETLNAGRWPANVLHDGSDEVVAGFPETSSGGGNGVRSESENIAMSGKNYARVTTNGQPASEGSAARFFYSAKAGPLDRIGTSHATVKPVDLMRWLARLVTPKGGHILEPFAGSGTTGIAAMAEGFDCTMIELLPDHCADIERKLAFLRGEGASRIIEHTRHKRNRDSGNDLPLFAA